MGLQRVFVGGSWRILRVPGEGLANACCCEPLVCNCNETLWTLFSSVTVGGATTFVDGVSGDIITCASGNGSVTKTFADLTDPYGSWTSTENSGQFGMAVDCADDGEGGYITTVTVGCVGSGVFCDAYFVGQGSVFQAGVCRIELGVAYPGLSPWGGTVTFN